MACNLKTRKLLDCMCTYRGIYGISNWTEYCTSNTDNFNSLNIHVFGSMEICSRAGYFESLRVSHGQEATEANLGLSFQSSIK